MVFALTILMGSTVATLNIRGESSFFISLVLGVIGLLGIKLLVLCHFKRGLSSGSHIVGQLSAVFTTEAGTVYHF